MKLQSLHTHSVYDDGKSTLEQMTRSAIAHGLDAVGFSGHSPIPGQSWTICPEDLPRYFAEIQLLKEKYRGTISLYCGLELELCSEVPEGPFDYMIGSVHHIYIADRWVSVDESAAVTRSSVMNLLGGDGDAYAKAYFSGLEQVADCGCCQIAGHLDLLTKYNEKDPLIDTESPVYRRAALRAAEALVSAGKIIEINTGAIGRGHRSVPYPELWLLQELRRMDARVTITADAHRADAVAGAYDQALELVQAVGFRELWMLQGAEFIPCPIE